MVDGLFEGNTLLNEVDGMVRNAIKCQVVSTTIQHSCYVLLDTAFTCQTCTRGCCDRVRSSACLFYVATVVVLASVCVSESR
jgi:hypothetical protein